MSSETSGTWPYWTAHFGESLDALRKFLQRSPEWAKVGRTFGPTRILTRSEAQRVIEAFRAHKAARKQKKVTANA
jgi:hypothetical protein